MSKKINNADDLDKYFNGRCDAYDKTVFINYAEGECDKCFGGASLLSKEDVKALSEYFKLI